MNYKKNINHPDSKKKDLNFNEINKENPFEVPDGYFDELPGKISQKISVIEPQARVFPVRKQIIYAAAAALILSLVVASIYIFRPVEDHFEIDLAGLTWDDVFDENSSMFNEIKEEMLIQALIMNTDAGEQIVLFDDNLELLYERDNKNNNNYNEDIIDYLLKDDINNELLF